MSHKRTLKVSSAFAIFSQLPLTAYSFRGPVACDFSGCSQGYGDLGIVGFIFFGSILIWAVYSFFKNKEFRTGVWWALAFLVFVIIVPLSFMRTDRTLTLTLMIVFGLIYFKFFNRGSGDIDKKKEPPKNADSSINKVKEGVSSSEVKNAIILTKKTQSFYNFDIRTISGDAKKSNEIFLNKNNPTENLGPSKAPPDMCAVHKIDYLTDASKLEVQLNEYIAKLIGLRIQKEIKKTAQMDILLWSACLLETKNNIPSAELLYRVARTKFLKDLNGKLAVTNKSIDGVNVAISYIFCKNQAEARTLAYKN
jgi:hypothetical protein